MAESALTQEQIKAMIDGGGVGQMLGNCECPACRDMRTTPKWMEAMKALPSILGAQKPPSDLHREIDAILKALEIGACHDFPAPAPSFENLRAIRCDTVEPNARLYSLVMPGGAVNCYHAEALVEIARFIYPPPKSGREILERMKDETRADIAEYEGMKTLRRYAWAVDVAVDVWPKPIWEITTPTPISPFVFTPSLRWTIYRDEPFGVIATEEIPLSPAVAPATLARMIAGIRDKFHDNFKLAARESRECAARFEVGTWQGITVHYEAEPADHIARAFTMRLPHDLDSLHGGRRAGLEG